MCHYSWEVDVLRELCSCFGEVPLVELNAICEDVEAEESGFVEAREALLVHQSLWPLEVQLRKLDPQVVYTALRCWVGDELMREAIQMEQMEMCCQPGINGERW